jgi:uncharacterized membrane protein YhaH (DUF805 family)
MRGSVESFDSAGGIGVIMGENGVRYPFAQALLPNTEISTGLAVLFDHNGESVTEAMVHPPGWSGKPVVMKFEEIDESKGPGLVTYFVVCLLKSFEIRGRAQRAEIWSFTALRSAFDIAVLSALAVAGVLESASLVYAAYFFLMFPASMTVAIRRFHDVGASGWRLLALAAPVIGWLYVLFVLYVVPSQRHTNRYARHPKAIRRATLAGSQLAATFD